MSLLQKKSDLFLTYCDPDEAYVYNERVAIMCGTGPLTEEAHECSKDDVKRFNEERKSNATNDTSRS